MRFEELVKDKLWAVRDENEEIDMSTTEEKIRLSGKPTNR